MFREKGIVSCGGIYINLYFTVDKVIIDEAFNYTRRMPQNEREAFAVFCALNVIRLGATEKVISNDYANGIAKPHVIKVVAYALEHPELNLIDKVYLDTS